MSDLSGGVNLEDEGGAVVSGRDDAGRADPDAGQKRQVAGLQLEDGHSPEKGIFKIRNKTSFSEELWKFELLMHLASWESKNGSLMFLLLRSQSLMFPLTKICLISFIAAERDTSVHSIHLKKWDNFNVL